jgi:hypothetical protein
VQKSDAKVPCYRRMLGERIGVHAQSRTVPGSHSAMPLDGPKLAQLPPT